MDLYQKLNRTFDLIGLQRLRTLNVIGRYGDRARVAGVTNFIGVKSDQDVADVWPAGLLSAATADDSQLIVGTINFPSLVSRLVPFDPWTEYAPIPSVAKQLLGSGWVQVTASVPLSAVSDGGVASTRWIYVRLHIDNWVSAVKGVEAANAATGTGSTINFTTADVPAMKLSGGTHAVWLEWGINPASARNGGHTAYSAGASITVAAATDPTALVRLVNKTVNDTQTTIAHGLSRTPVVVGIVPKADARVWESQAPDGTNIYLTAAPAAGTSVTADITIK